MHAPARGGGARRAARLTRTVAAVALVVLVALSGCLTASGPSADTASGTATATETETPATTPAALDSQLAGLVAADNRTAYAEASGLDYDAGATAGTAGTTAQGDTDGRVRAVVVLDANATLPGGYDLSVVARADELVEVRVAVDDLSALAREDGVRLVRPPQTPAAGGTGGAVSP